MPFPTSFARKVAFISELTRKYGIMTYAALQREHIQSAGLNRRQQRYAPRCHAAIIGVVESQGLGIFELSKDQIVKLIMPTLALSGIMGWLLNGVIQAVLGMLIPRVIQWLKDKLDGWLDRNKSTAGGWTFNANDAFFAANTELQPIFADARTFLASGRLEL